jgi:hypothetical protein
MADFTFHPFTKTIPIPPGSPNARARITVGSGAGVSNSEHILLDNVRLSVLTSAGDTDGDGMPDAYETANGLNPNSNTDRDTDLDGDGQSNHSEYQAGTEPDDSASVLRITAAGLSATNEVSLTWNSVAGKKYQAYVSSALGNTPATLWTALPGVVTATGSSTTLPAGVILPAGQPRYFLRIGVVP